MNPWLGFSSWTGSGTFEELDLRSTSTSSAFSFIIFTFFLFKTKLTNNFIKHLFFGGHTKLYFPASLMVRSHAMSANGFLSLHGFLLFFLFFFLAFWLENSLSTDWEGQVSAAQNWNKARRVEKRSKIGWKMFANVSKMFGYVWKMFGNVSKMFEYQS